MLELSLKEQKQINGGQLIFYIYIYDGDRISSTRTASTASEANTIARAYRKMGARVEIETEEI